LAGLDQVAFPVFQDRLEHRDSLDLQDRLVRPVPRALQELPAALEDQEDLVSFRDFTAWPGFGSRVYRRSAGRKIVSKVQGDREPL